VTSSEYSNEGSEQKQEYILVEELNRYSLPQAKNPNLTLSNSGCSSVEGQKEFISLSVRLKHTHILPFSCQQ